MFSMQYRSQQAFGRLDTFKHFQIGHHLIDAVAQYRIALQPLDNRLRKKRVDSVDPFRRRQAGILQSTLALASP